LIGFYKESSGSAVLKGGQQDKSESYESDSFEKAD